MSRVPLWRKLAALAVLAGLFLFLGVFAPYYFRNLELQNFVSGITRGVENQGKSDDVLRTWVLEKAHQLDLPVTEDNVHIRHSADAMYIDVRYAVRVDLPGYTVDLHFYPGAGSR